MKSVEAIIKYNFWFIARCFMISIYRSLSCWANTPIPIIKSSFQWSSISSISIIFSTSSSVTLGLNARVASISGANLFRCSAMLGIYLSGSWTVIIHFLSSSMSFRNAFISGDPRFTSPSFLSFPAASSFACRSSRVFVNVAILPFTTAL